MAVFIYENDNSELPGRNSSLQNYRINRNVKKAVTAIMEDFKNRVPSDELSKTLHAIANNTFNEEDPLVLLSVVYNLSNNDQVGNVGSVTAARTLLAFLLMSAKWGPYAIRSNEPDVQGSVSYRGTSMKVDRNDAQAAAKQIIETAKAEAEQIIETAKAEAEQIRAEAEAEARRVRQEAQEQIQSAQNIAKAQADRIYENQKEDFVPRAVREMIEKYRREDAEEYRKSDEDRERLCRDLEQAHAKLCDQVKTLQADMNDALNSAQNRLLNGLTQWRESFYKKEAMDLADCYVNLHRMLSPLDSQVAEAEAAAARLEQAGYTPMSASSPAEAGAARKLAEQLRKLWNKLDRFAKQLRNAMLGVGLDVYIPVEGDRFDPAQHTLGEGDEKDDMMENREIAKCILPGVRALQPGGSSRSFESLIRAEVELKQGGIR